MTDDIVARLRTVDEFSDAVKIMDEAADEIERLREQVTDLKNLYRLRSQLGDAVDR